MQQIGAWGQSFIDGTWNFVVSVWDSVFGSDPAPKTKDVTNASKWALQQVQRTESSTIDTVKAIARTMVNTASQLAKDTAFKSAVSVFNVARVIDFEVANIYQALNWSYDAMLHNVNDAETQTALLDDRTKTLFGWEHAFVLNNVLDPLLQATNGITTYLGTQLVPYLNRSFQGVEQQIAQDAAIADECCAANTNWRNQVGNPMKSLLDRLKPWTDLLEKFGLPALLGIFAAFGAFDAQTLIREIESFLAGEGHDLESYVLAWLG
jgi:hypothetical protein